MEQSKLSKFIASSYLLLQIPAIVLSLWSFFFYKGGKASLFNNNFNNNANKDLNNVDSIIGAGVCVLGRFVGVFIVLYILVSSFLLFKDDLAGKNNYEHVLFAIMITNSVLVSLLFIFVAIFNKPLLIRTLPFITLQIGIILMLYTNYLLVKDEKKLNKT
tara:strand:- start:884 stop:1363 length:480 start_codon:yes stop_codon:yes gene_type:complete